MTILPLKKMVLYREQRMSKMIIVMVHVALVIPAQDSARPSKEDPSVQHSIREEPLGMKESGPNHQI